MKLGIISASPRGKNSNTTQILNWLTKDIEAQVEKTTVLAVKTDAQAESVASIKDMDYYVVGFPLYTDAMPGITMQFFETMLAQKQAFAGKPILFVVHSGFPEAKQSRMVERYTEHFAGLMGMAYMGCIVWGGSEAIKHAPAQYFTTKAEALGALGKKILKKQAYSKAEVILPGHSESLSKFSLFLMKVLPFLNDIFWNMQLRKNDAFKARFNAPYQS